MTNPVGGGEPVSITTDDLAGGLAPQEAIIEEQQSSNQQRAPSSAGQRAPSNACSRPPTNACRRPPSNMDCVNGQANYCSAEDAEIAYNRINESGCYIGQPTSKTYDENIVVDWPMSNIGQEQVQRFTNQTEETIKPPQEQRPGTSTTRLQTPLPPLNLQGYGPDRPTYATWREKWRQEQKRLNLSGNDNNNNIDNDDDENISNKHNSDINSVDNNFFDNEEDDDGHDDNNNNNNNNNNSSSMNDDIESSLIGETTNDRLETGDYSNNRGPFSLDFSTANLEVGVLGETDGIRARKRRAVQKIHSDSQQNTDDCINRTEATSPQEFVSSSMSFDVEDSILQNDSRRSFRRVLVDKFRSLTRWSRWHGANDNVVCLKYEKIDHDRQN